MNRAPQPTCSGCGAFLSRTARNGWTGQCRQRISLACERAMACLRNARLVALKGLAPSVVYLTLE